MRTVAALAGVQRNNGIIRSHNGQCLENLALMCHSLMAMQFGAGDLD